MAGNAKQINDTIPIAGMNRTLFEFGDFDHSNIPFEAEEIPVIIIGSSMVGMFMGLLLGYHGIHSVSFDRHPSTAIHPRAALFLLRTVEILRQLGLEDKFIEQSRSNFDLDAGMLVVEKLYKGKTLASFQESDPAEVAKITPSVRLWLTQNMFEPLLRGEALNYGAEQRFGQSVVHYEKVSDGVIVVVKENDTGHMKKFKTKYLVASDGNRSATRKKEKIDWHGPGHINNAISIDFKANLVPYLGTRAVHGTTYVKNPNINGGFRLETGGKGGFMIVTSAKGREDGFEPDSVSEQEARTLFEDCSGIAQDECDLEIQSISYWSVAAFTADRFASEDESVFLVGDACHVMPPTGGMGGNTGVADAYNLAWKVAYVLKGYASPGLMTTYNQERQPGANFFVQQAFARLVSRVFHGKGYDHEPELPDIMCELGYRYTEGAICPTHDENFSKSVEDPYKPYVLPGGRIPHVALTSAQGQLSSLDLIKQNFVLFTTETNSPWLEAAKKQTIPIDAFAINGSSTYRDENSAATEAWRLTGGEALLVRPDGIIAWRSGENESCHDERLKQALNEILRLE